MAGTFTAVTVAWIFFRADSIGHAVDYLKHAWSPGSLELLDLQGTIQFLFLLSAVSLGIIAEIIYVSSWKSRFWNKYTLGFWALLILIYAQNSQSESFIYFQF